MEIAEWERELLKSAKEILIKGGKLEFIVYKRDNKRKPVIHTYPENERSLKEIEIID